MKKIVFNALLCLLALFVSCKKSAIPEESTYLIKVKEYKTNMPLPGVKISLYKCTNYDAVFGCQSKSVFATHSTDQKGEYSFIEAEYLKVNEGIILSKPQYFDTQGNAGEISMQPEAWVKIGLKTSKSYPDTCLIDLNTTGELGNGSSLTFKAPEDSVVNFRLFGNEINVVNWVLYTKLIACYQYCPRDTLAYGSFSLSPKKFESLTSSIDY
jgi:hypothetical protein